MKSITVKRVSKRNPKKVLSRHTFIGKTVKAAKSAARGFFRRMKGNVEQGFFDATGFHPIRASRDYSERRVQKAQVKKYHKRARKRRSAIS